MKGSRRHRGLVAGVIVFTLVAIACSDTSLGSGVRGSGVMATESREVSGFTEVHLLASGTVSIAVTGEESLTIEAEDNILPILTSEVVDGRLELGSDESYDATRDITYTITMPELTDVRVSGSGSVSVGEFSAEELGADIGGSGSIVMSGVEAGKVAVTIAGSGSVRLDGTAGELDVAVPGSGSVEAAELPAPWATVSIDGSGRAVVHATESLDVVINGSGSVVYRGDPAVTSTINGSGSVSPG